LCLIDPVNKKIVWHSLGFKSYNDLESILSQKGVEKRDATSITITNSKKVQSLFSILYFNKNILVFNVLDQASYTLALFSPQGSEIDRQKYISRSPGLQKVDLNHRSVSYGNYIVQINNGFQKVSKHITVLK